MTPTFRNLADLGLYIYDNTALHPGGKDFSSHEGNNKQEKVTGSHISALTTSNQESISRYQENKEVNNQSVNMTVAHCAQRQKTRVILSTAQVYVYDDEDKPMLCRALLDPGSQLNLVTKALANKLKLPIKKIDTPLSGVNQSNVRVQSSVAIELESLINNFHTKQEFLILSHITEKLPHVQLNTSQIKIPEGILLADPAFAEPGTIDMLLGAGLFWKLLCEGQISQVKGQPVLQKTLLGWIVGGEQVMHPSPLNIKEVCNLNIISEIDERIEKFWKMEELTKKEPVTAEERYCEEYFTKTYTRNCDGRFKVKLPQRQEVQLGNSEKEATKRYYALEQRLYNNPKLKEEYFEFLKDYERSGHITPIDSSKGTTVYYLPHHPVIKEESSTTRLRVVFDGSAKTSMKTSLNDELLAGPNLQEEIINIILRFRMHNFVITADITKMFRQIEVAEEDRDLQRIIWRKEGDRRLTIYELNTVTYGTTCAPYLAMRCLKQLAIENENKYPRAVESLKRDFYMDDVLTGSNIIEDTIDLQKQLTQLLLEGQFELRKWRTNNKKILEHLSEECKANKLLVIDKQEAIKTLGLLWDSKTDALKFKLKKKGDTKITKRIILSAIAEIYDPIGIIGPVIMQAKILMQELWLLKLSWDGPLPPSLETKWKNYYSSIEELNQLEIPRSISPANAESTIRLHGFGDASEKGYGDCLYALSYNKRGKAHSNLIGSKSRVAPLKKITLPRLELCAALLLARLVETVIKAIGKERIQEVVLWSDSTIVLHWLQTPPNQLKTFVANRVVEIQETTTNYEWRHIPTLTNPADLLSRGTTVENLIKNQRWWHGPEWLNNKASWPEKKIEFGSNVPEKKREVVLIAADTTRDIIRKYSSFSKLERIVAYCLRFLERAKGKGSLGPLTVQELQKSQRVILRMTQLEGFPEELRALKSHQGINHKSQILTLHPFLDQHGIIRVGGRLQRANVSEKHKHPIVLPAKHFITNLILRETHVKLKHCGPEHLLSVIRTNYWPISGRREARKVTRSCIKCFKYKPKPGKTLMGDLPEHRVKGAQKPFVTTGVDYAGPLQMRESRRRGRIPVNKVYIAIFTCFMTKAVHLEIVTDLTSEAFLAALRRFVARRGICHTLYSDNGTNFVGAARELGEVYDFLSRSEAEIATTLAHQKIEWKFIPPRAPHFGGLWEAAVKSVKKHLYTVTQGLTYTYEEYYTLLVEIEAVLNSRPLTPLSSDPHDFSPLTPSHFLIGTSLYEPATKDDTNVPTNLLSRWQHLQKIKRDFWRRWKKEYLHQLQTRTKWVKGTQNLKIGTLVLLVDDQTPPLNWNLGRVTQVHPGSDGIVRVATVKTSSGLFKRPVTKLCSLPYEHEK